jgi:hypothetical protein
LAKREKREKALPDNTGKAWSELEDSELLSAFDDVGSSIKDIAAKHVRTKGAIQLGYFVSAASRNDCRNLYLDDSQR